jgi:HK97 gp10 family phage protein
VGIVITDNVDDVLKAVAKLEAKAVGDITRESRKAMRKQMNTYKPYFKSVTPKKTGALRRSVKIKSRSRKGVTKLTMGWGEDYAGYVNFARGSKHSRKITSAYRSMKAKMDRDIKSSILLAQKDYLRSRGFTVK